MPTETRLEPIKKDEQEEEREYNEDKERGYKTIDKRVGPDALKEAEEELVQNKPPMTREQMEESEYNRDKERGFKIGEDRPVGMRQGIVEIESVEASEAIRKAAKEYDDMMVAKDAGNIDVYQTAREEFNKDKRDIDQMRESEPTEPPPTLHHLEDHPEQMSVEYIQRQFELSKSQGVLSRYYWESLLKEAKEAEQRTPAPQREKEQASVNEARQGAVENLKNNRKEGWGKRFKDSVRSKYETAKDKVKSIWPFWKERAKGLATAGALEYIHAEKFRRATRDVGRDTETQSRLVKIEDYVPFDELTKKAKEAGLIKEGETFRDADKKQLEQVSNEVLGERILVNEHVEDSIVADAKERLSKRLEKFISTGGTKGLTEEKWAQIEPLLRQNIKNIRKNTALDSMTDYIKLYRQGFDAGESGWNKWKMRYLYGAVESTLWLSGIAILFSKLSGAGAMPLLPPKPILPGTESLPQVTGLDPMDKSVWHTISNVAKNEFGINLNNDQLLRFGKGVVSNPNNHIGVKIWNIPGNPLDIHMQQGHLLDLKYVRDVLTQLSVHP